MNQVIKRHDHSRVDQRRQASIELILEGPLALLWQENFQLNARSESRITQETNVTHRVVEGLR